MIEDQPDKRGDYPDLSDLITLKQAAEICGLSYSHLRLLARKGTIWATRLGHEWLTTQQAINDYRAQDRKRGRKSRKGTDQTPPGG